jgi:ABC-type branched-subunit amino acid transport system ATPase component
MSRILETRGITKRFGGLTAVDSLDLHVDEKEILGFMGPNGAGKTTAFNLIMGDLRQDSGEIFLDGENISNLPTHKRVKLGIARTYQVTRPLREWNIAENIRISMIKDGIGSIRESVGEGETIRRIAEETDLADQLQNYPDELPIGALRKLEVARAFANNPKIILIDEAFAGLTAHEIDFMIKLLRRKKEAGMGFVIIDHNLDALAKAVDRVVVLYLGKKLADGSFSEVTADDKVKRAYLGG